MDCVGEGRKEFWHYNIETIDRHQEKKAQTCNSWSVIF